MIPAGRNRTICIDDHDIEELSSSILKVDDQNPDFYNNPNNIVNQVIRSDIFDIVDLLPDSFVDLLFIDPPYNLTKAFNSTNFRKTGHNEYFEWIDSWISKMIRLLKPNASIYLCGDWRSSAANQLIIEKYFNLKNRITFEREKGRGSKSNWKNNSEDIWFATMSDDYTFNLDDVKISRRVRAPYRDNGEPKDWFHDKDGKYRLTCPSNIWTDITIPFWSMPENTEHPTQKPEKLLAKIILAGTNKNDIVFDPFCGSGTTGTVAKKLGRRFLMIDIDEKYCLLALKRLKQAENDRNIQGYHDGIFWERNSTILNRKQKIT